MCPNHAGEILVVGGGPVGATLALALQQKGIPATILEARSHGAAHQDQRALALSYGSRLIFERLGLWTSLASQATAIKTIHISQRGSLGRSRLRANDYSQEALGYVLPYGVLSKALDSALNDSSKIQVVYNAQVANIEATENQACVSFLGAANENAQQISVALAVLADGGNSLTHIPELKRETTEYGHSALVAKVSSELPHDNIAYERFTPAGPVALLPNGDEFSLVWTGEQAVIAELLQVKEEMFLEELHRHFGDRVGRFLQVGPRSTFPLKMAYLDPVAMPHLAVIGNAAQTMHPVAGQGFNIGMRDAWELATCIAATDPVAWGSRDMLQSYRKIRESDTKSGLLFTDFLVNVFSNELIGLSGMRAAGLGILDVVKPLKQRLVEKMSFGT